MAVSKAIAAGRLRASVVRVENGDPKIIDPELADQEWNTNTDRTRMPAAVKAREIGPTPTEAPRRTAAVDDNPEAFRVDGVTFNEANTREKLAKAETAEIKLRKMAGELIEASEVKTKMQGVFTACRARLLGLPSRARQALPHLTIADIQKLEDLVREALAELADGNLG